MGVGSTGGASDDVSAALQLPRSFLGLGAPHQQHALQRWRGEVALQGVERVVCLLRQVP